VVLPPAAFAAGKEADFVQTDGLATMISYQFETSATSPSTMTIADKALLVGYVGLQYHVLDRVRLGVNVLFSEQLHAAPTPTEGSDLGTLAFLPQAGWDFFSPLYAGFVDGWRPNRATSSARGLHKVSQR
jgi:hypothetical protein